MSLFTKLKLGAKFYFDGTKKLYQNVKETTSLMQRMKNDPNLIISRREFFLISKTGKDMKRMGWFLACIVLTPELLPFLTGIFPNLVPSTCVSSSVQENIYKSLQSNRKKLHLDWQSKSGKSLEKWRLIPDEFYSNFDEKNQALDLFRIDLFHSKTIRELNKALGLKVFTLLESTRRKDLQEHLKLLEIDDAYLMNKVKEDEVDLKTLDISDVKEIAEMRGISSNGKDHDLILAEIEEYFDFVEKGVPREFLLIKNIKSKHTF